MNILDVRLQDAYDQSHIPGSTVNPVFQVGFVDRMPEDWGKEDPVQLVAQDGESEEALMAMEKLQRAGYTQLEILEGGLDGWVAQGNEPDGSHQAAPSPAPLHGAVAVDLEASEIQWTGRNLINRHYGTLHFSSATLTFENGTLTGGTFIVDWDSLACTDLAGTEVHDVLMAHLKDHDFFDVDAYEAPQVEMTSVTPVADATRGAPNLNIEANLTMKGVTHPITFSATGGSTGEGFAFQAELPIDLTLWNVKYASGKLFKGLGMHLVNDTLEIGLKVVTG